MFGILSQVYLKERKPKRERGLREERREEKQLERREEGNRKYKKKK